MKIELGVAALTCACRQPPVARQSGSAQMGRIRLALAAPVLALLTVGGSAPAGAVELAPHRAVYELKLARASTSAGISNLGGKMVYEAKGAACAGYTLDMRLVTNITGPDGEAMVSDMRSKSEEGVGAKTFGFDINTYQNQNLSEQSEGKAVRSPDPGDVQVTLRRPDETDFTLPGNIMFPAQHSLATIEAAEAGKRLFSADLYDGSESGRKIYATTTQIGKPIAPFAAEGDDALRKFANLAGLRSWPVAMAYFDTDSASGDGLPAYEISFRMFENGVTGDLKIDYGEFALDGKLLELEMAALPACAQ